MLTRSSRSVWLLGWIAVLLTAAGCFQPAGAGLEATSVAQGAPTYTAIPTETPIIPTETPTDLPIPTDTPEMPTETPTPTPTATFDPFSVLTGTAVAMAQIDDIFLTATQYFFETQEAVGNIPIIDVIDPVAQQGPSAQDLLATQIIQTATAEIAIPITLTAQAILGEPQEPTTDPFLVLTLTSQPVQATPTSGVVVSGNDCVYEVQATDPNLFRIGLRYGVAYEDIARASGLVNANLIYVGQQLVIPGCGTTGVTPPPTSTDGTAQSGSGSNYVVQQNDTLFQLSLTYGVTVHQIAAANGISNINLIYIGQELVIP